MTQTTPPQPAFADAAAIWNQRFSGDDYHFGTEPNTWLREHSSALNVGDRVLCVADGEGRNSVWLARQGILVDAFDISEVGVRKAKKLAADHQVAVNYVISDCDSFDWAEGAYDGVVAIFVQFADPAMRERLFNNIRRCLKPGGHVVLQGYTPKQLEFKTGGPPQVSHLYTEALLREAFEDFDVLDLVDYEAELDEGARHVGQSALIGMVARRRRVVA